MKIKHAFETLGISELSSELEIKQAYRILVKKYHPDVNTDKSSRATFELIQQAYELIQAYLVYKESPEYTVNIEKQRRKQRVRNVVKQKAAQSEFNYAKMLYELALFRTTKRFYLSSILAVISFIVAVFLLFDYHKKPHSSYEPIEGIQLPIGGLDQLSVFDNVYMYVHNHKVSVSPIQVPELSSTQYVKVTITPYIHQLLEISYIKNGKNVEVEFYNFYNDAIYLICLLLSLGMVLFVYRKRNMLYFFMIKYYNIYFLPLLLIYIILGNARILRLFGIV